MEVAFIGLGQMGSGMADSLLAAGHAVTVWNRDNAKAEPFVARGAKVAAGLATAARVFGQSLYLPPFMAHQNGVSGYEGWEHKLERGRIAINHALREHDTVGILSILFDRLYVLRNQLVHGGATWSSDVNRDQVRDGASLLGCLLPIFVDLMMDNPEHEWPMPNYPVVD